MKPYTHFKLDDRTRAIPMMNITRATKCTDCGNAFNDHPQYQTHENGAETKAYCHECSKKCDKNIYLIISKNNVTEDLMMKKY